jgi:hypothetical protein
MGLRIPPNLSWGTSKKRAAYKTISGRYTPEYRIQNSGVKQALHPDNSGYLENLTSISLFL